MDLGHKPHASWPTTVVAPPPQTDKDSPTLPPLVLCAPDEARVVADSVLDAAGRWALTTSYTTCLSKVKATTRSTIHTMSISSSITATPPPSMSSSFIPESTTLMTNVPSPITTSTSSNHPSEAATSISSPGLDWKPPRNNSTIAIAVTVPMVSIALSCVAAYFIFYKRKKKHSYGYHSNTNVGTSVGGGSAARVPTVPQTVANPGYGNANANNVSVMGGFRFRSEEEQPLPWTKRGHRAYGDGKRRPPPLSPRQAAAILNNNGNGCRGIDMSEDGDAAWPLSSPSGRM